MFHKYEICREDEQKFHMFVNENGYGMGLPPNLRAGLLTRLPIVGDVALVAGGEKNLTVEEVREWILEIWKRVP